MCSRKLAHGCRVDQEPIAGFATGRDRTGDPTALGSAQHIVRANALPDLKHWRRRVPVLRTSALDARGRAEQDDPTGSERGAEGRDALERLPARVAGAERRGRVDPTPDPPPGGEELHLSSIPGEPTVANRGLGQVTAAESAGRRRDQDLEAAVDHVTA